MKAEYTKIHKFFFGISLFQKKLLTNLQSRSNLKLRLGRNLQHALHFKVQKNTEINKS